MEMIRKTKAAYTAISIAIILLGLVLIIWPGVSLNILCSITGGILVILGIIKILGYFSDDLYRLAFQFDFAHGIFAIIMGSVLLLHQKHIISILPVIMGIFILADGVLRIQTAKDAKFFGITKWWMILGLGCITTVCGLLLIIKPFESALAMTMLLGLTLLIDGIQNLWVVVYTVKEDKRRYVDAEYEEIM